MRFCPSRRTPVAGVDPIHDAEAALAVVALAVQCPAVAETVVLLLDHERRGISIVVVSGTAHPDDVVEVVEHVAGSAAATGVVGALVVATVRPGGSVLADDADRWLELSGIAEEAGVEVVEWFVVGRSIQCPRDLLGERPRW